AEPPAAAGAGARGGPRDRDGQALPQQKPIPGLPMKKILVVAALAAVAALAIWILIRQRSAAPDEELKPVAQVQVSPLRIGPITESLAAFGLVEAAPSGARTLALAYDA